MNTEPPTARFANGNSFAAARLSQTLCGLTKSEYPMKFPVVVKHKDIVLKLFDWMSYPKDQAARNVEAFDSDGNHIWTIESLGGHAPTDCYTNISSKNGSIHAFNFQCFDCVVDERDGKIISRKFTK